MAIVFSLLNFNSIQLFQSSCVKILVVVAFVDIKFNWSSKILLVDKKRRLL